jgi:DNA polymerase-1
MPRTLYIIDGYAQVFRAFYAIRNGMRSPNTGEPTQAVFGTTAMLLKLWAQYSPDYVVIAWDAPGKTFRDGLFADYKATRSPTPEDLKAQVPRIMELFFGFGIPVVGREGLEADDIIACIVSQLKAMPENEDLKIRVVSKDKDLEQLLCDGVSMFDVHTGAEASESDLLAAKGVSPAQVIDLLALIGDSVDNVPGVAGIGPKTAVQLIQQYGSIDGILANLPDIKEKVREKLETCHENLLLSRELVTLNCSTDLSFSLETARFRPSRIAELIALFKELGFHRFQDELNRLAIAAAVRTNNNVPMPSAVSPAKPFDLWSFEQDALPISDPATS